MTRRSFFSKLIAATALITGCGSVSSAYSTRGSARDSLRLVFYTDVHTRTEWDTPRALALAAAAINAQNPDLVIAGGDLITDGFQSSAARVAPRWDEYMKMHHAIQADVYPVVGNHDLVAARPSDGSPAAENPRSIYLSRLNLDRTYYSFNAAGFHFILLDSIQIAEDDYQYHGTIGPEQLEWLKRDLSNLPREIPIILATHMPLVTSFFMASRGATFTARPNRVVVNNRDVLEIIENYNVILVLQGHLHIKEMIQWRHTTFVTGGAICGKWWRGQWYGTPEGFNVLTLTGNHVDWQYIDYGWKARRPINK